MKPNGVDGMQQAFERYFDEFRQRRDKPPREVGERRRVFVCGDLHGNPSQDLLAQCIDYDPDLIVIGGDLFDSKQVIPRRHLSGRQVTMETEEIRLRAWLNALLEHTFAYIEIMRGNHDEYVRLTQADLLPAWLSKYFVDPVQLLLHDYPEDRLRQVNDPLFWHTPEGQAKEFVAESRYMYMVGDALLSHGSFAHKDAGGAVHKLALWVDRWRHILNIDPRLLIMFHTHKLSWAREQDGWQTLIEPGMCCEPEAEAYKADQHKTSWSPGARGACVFEQVRDGETWKTDVRTIRLLYPE